MTKSSPDPSRPTILCEAGAMERIVDEAEAALIASQRGLYQRGGEIVSIGEAKLIKSDGTEFAAQRILSRGDHALLEDIGVAASFQRYDGRSKRLVNIDPPMAIAKTLRERSGRLSLPVLTGVINAPTIRADGTLVEEPGYDARTGLIFEPENAVFPSIKKRPTKADAHVAMDELGALIRGFPFVEQADRSVAISALLTSVVRRTLPTAPLHAFTAPTAGSGKSKLVDTASVLATGHPAGVIAQGKNEAELEKRLGAVFLAADPVIAIDNCEDPLGGDFICQVLTQESVKVRILGFSKAPEIPTAAFVTATGNNLVITGDLVRRTLLCRLDAGVERPELRPFDFDPVAMAQTNRARLVSAALTALMAYREAGSPRVVDDLGSFETWSKTVRSTLIWLGYQDPAQTMESARSLDPKLEALRQVAFHWHDIIGPQRKALHEVISIAATHQAFHDAIAMATGRREPDARSLANWMGRQKDRVIDGRRFRQAGTVNGYTRWELTDLGI